LFTFSAVASRGQEISSAAQQTQSTNSASTSRFSTNATPDVFIGAALGFSISHFEVLRH
jgi:hypothetical protein